MSKASRKSTTSTKLSTLQSWLRPLLVLAAVCFSVWFFFQVQSEHKNEGADLGIGQSAESSKRIRGEVRNWFRKAFPNSAARGDERFGFFEMEQGEDSVSQSDWVILAHGIDEPGGIWNDLVPDLITKGYRVLEMRYPNDQPIHESARLLKQEFELLYANEGLPDGVHLVGHSMGGLVFREFITHPDLLPSSTWSDLSLVKTLIQLGTPNHGSWLASYRWPIELRDHLFKNNGKDALLAMIWDGAGEAQIDLKPGSTFLTELNERPFPSSIYWVGVAGTGSPANLAPIRDWSGWKHTKLPGALGDIQGAFPELFAGTGDGAVSVDSLECEEMDEVHFVDAHHRNMVLNPRVETPPAIPIVLAVLERD